MNDPRACCAGWICRRQAAMALAQPLIAAPTTPYVPPGARPVPRRHARVRAPAGQHSVAGHGPRAAGGGAQVRGRGWIRVSGLRKPGEGPTVMP